MCKINFIRVSQKYQNLLFIGHFSHTGLINLIPGPDCHILAQAALREPPEVAFAMHSWPLLLPTFAILSFYLGHPGQHVALSVRPLRPSSLF